MGLDPNKILITSCGCHIWLGLISEKGYGRCKDGRAHRVAWECENGPIPKGIQICHTCDIRCCVNFEHLFAGTPKQNSEDMVAKGRAAKPWLGKKRPEATRKKISDSHKGKEFSTDHKANISKAKKGIKLSGKQLIANRAAADNRIGSKAAESTKNKMSISAKAAWARRKAKS